MSTHTHKILNAGWVNTRLPPLVSTTDTIQLWNCLWKKRPCGGNSGLPQAAGNIACYMRLAGQFPVFCRCLSLWRAVSRASCLTTTKLPARLNRAFWGLWLAAIGCSGCGQLTYLVGFISLFMHAKKNNNTTRAVHTCLLATLTRKLLPSHCLQAWRSSWLLQTTEDF